MRISFVALALALVLGTNHLHAAIGESQSEIAKRYGGSITQPMGMTNQDLTVYFKYKDYVVGVTFLQGVCNRETYTRQDKKALSDTEIQMLLDANSNGSKWVEMDDTKNAKLWVLESKQAMAGYFKAEPYLSIQTPDMLAFDEAVKKMTIKRATEASAPVTPSAPKP